jgi:hypothetical protein
MLRCMLLAAAGFALLGGAAHAQGSPAAKTPDMTAPPGEYNTMPPATPTAHHKRHPKASTKTPTTTTTPEATTPATTPSTTKTPSPPDLKPSPPPDQIKTEPGTNVPAKEPARPMPGQEPTPPSTQPQEPPPISGGAAHAVGASSVSAPGARRDNRRSRGRSCGRASRLRHISPVAGTGDIWNPRDLRTAPASRSDTCRGR